MAYDSGKKPNSFAQYWLASKAWERKGLTLASGRALVNAGYLTVEDLSTASDLELAMIPRIGDKTLKTLCGLTGRTMSPKDIHVARLQKRRSRNN